MSHPFDSILVVAFGGPEGPDEVIPFLENVLRGRNVPRARMLEVAEHYQQFGGVSPLNAQVRELISALRIELDAHEIDLPIHWGNRNWHPLLPATVQQMAVDGRKRALALVLAAYSSYSSCRQYRENIEAAREAVNGDAPVIEKIRVFYNHPDFIAANVDHAQQAIEEFPAELQSQIRFAFTAHSIPSAMAAGCNYSVQLEETCRLVAETLAIPADHWRLVYQSRSGRPSDPWLEPDICDHLEQSHLDGARNVVVMPIGFLSDHIEVLFDLDDEARATCMRLGMRMIRAKSVGTHPRFVAMLRELIQERLAHEIMPRSCGRYGASHDVCPPLCCPMTT